MTEHVYEYCMDHMVTGGNCCPEGLERTDCKLIPAFEGHNKERHDNRVVFWFYAFLEFSTCAAIIGGVAFGVLAWGLK